MMLAGEIERVWWRDDYIPPYACLKKSKFLQEISQNPLQFGKECGIILHVQRGIAQLVEQWSPKPRVLSSNLSAPAI